MNREEYIHYIETGEVSESIIDSISKKIMSDLDLSVYELGIFHGKVSEVNNRIRDLKHEMDKVSHVEKNINSGNLVPAYQVGSSIFMDESRTSKVSDLAIMLVVYNETSEMADRFLDSLTPILEKHRLKFYIAYSNITNINSEDALYTLRSRLLESGQLVELIEVIEPMSIGKKRAIVTSRITESHFLALDIDDLIINPFYIESVISNGLDSDTTYLLGIQTIQETEVTPEIFKDLRVSVEDSRYDILSIKEFSNKLLSKIFTDNLNLVFCMTQNILPTKFFQGRDKVEWRDKGHEDVEVILDCLVTKTKRVCVPKRNSYLHIRSPRCYSSGIGLDRVKWILESYPRLIRYSIKNDLYGIINYVLSQNISYICRKITTNS